MQTEHQNSVCQPWSWRETAHDSRENEDFVGVGFVGDGLKRRQPRRHLSIAMGSSSSLMDAALARRCRSRRRGPSSSASGVSWPRRKEAQSLVHTTQACHLQPPRHCPHRQASKEQSSDSARLAITRNQRPRQRVQCRRQAARILNLSTSVSNGRVGTSYCESE